MWLVAAAVPTNNVSCVSQCGSSPPRWAYPGCPGLFKLGKAVPTCKPVTGLASIRCCGATAPGLPSCISVCHLDAVATAPSQWVSKTPWSVEQMEPLTLEGSRGMFETHAAASGECHARGLRLCTTSELDGRRCCGLGCNMDPRQVWTADLCPPRKCEADCRAHLEDRTRLMGPASYDAMVDHVTHGSSCPRRRPLSPHLRSHAGGTAVAIVYWGTPRSLCSTNPSHQRHLYAPLEASGATLRVFAHQFYRRDGAAAIWGNAPLNARAVTPRAARRTAEAEVLHLLYLLTVLTTRTYACYTCFSYLLGAAVPCPQRQPSCQGGGARRLAVVAQHVTLLWHEQS